MNKKVVKFSAIGFILSAIGAAVGLGNIWRFPEQMVNGGGGSFIIIYFLILLLVCLPLFMLELNYGVFSGKGVVKCFGANNRRLGVFVGWKQTLLITFLSFYYLAIIAWVGIAFVLSLVPETFENWSAGTTEMSSKWFNKNILKTSDDANIGISELEFSPWVIISIVVVFVLVCLILAAGVKNGLEKANYVFVPGFFFILIGLTIYVLFFLKDGQHGAEALFDFNLEKINNGKIWFEATKQGIFSTGILIGILICFSKNADVRMDKNSEAILVVLFDTFIALIAGLLIVGLISHDVGGDSKIIDGSETDEIRTKKIIKGIQAKFETNKNLGGSGLLFAYLPGLFLSINSGSGFGWGNVLMASFTLTLLFAALSSMIALLEVGLDGLEENFNFKKKHSIATMVFLTAIFLVFYGTSIGPSLVDDQDSIVVLFVTIMGIFQIFILLNNERYKRVITTNAQYTFLKLTTFNWLKVVIYTFTVPLLIVLSIFGILEITGVMHILNTDYNEYVSWLSLGKTTAFKLSTAKLVSFVMFGLLLVFTAICSFLYLKKDNNQRKIKAVKLNTMLKMKKEIK